MDALVSTGDKNKAQYKNLHHDTNGRAHENLKEVTLAHVDCDRPLSVTSGTRVTRISLPGNLQVVSHILKASKKTPDASIFTMDGKTNTRH